jgi:hypothetical protein
MGLMNDSRAQPTDSRHSRGLRGEAYVRRNQTSPTRDGDSFGRWVAEDESGWSGEDLYRPDDPYFVMGSVAMDDETATPVVEDLRRAAGIMQRNPVGCPGVWVAGAG